MKNKTRPLKWLKQLKGLSLIPGTHVVEGNNQSPELLLTSDECDTQAHTINVFFKSCLFV